MKPLLILSCFFCSSAGAQEGNKDSVLHKMLQEKVWNNSPMVFKYDSRMQKIVPSNRDSSGRLLPGIHQLPQDGMICFVPDTKDIAAIPNVYKGKVSVPFTGYLPRIPNPVPMQSFQFRSKK